MAKTKPIGVRFDEDLLSVLKEDENIESPQRALNFLSNFYRDNKKGRVDFTELISKSKIFDKKPMKEELKPPSHLKGIELSIWKSENGIK